MATARRGRPPKPEGEVRTKTLAIKLLDAEHAALSAKAAVAGMSLSEYVRAALRDYGKRRKP